MSWTKAKNKRRCHLIDKEINGTIRPVEKVELDRLQEEMLVHRRAVAPLPINDLRMVYDQFKGKE